MFRKPLFLSCLCMLVFLACQPQAPKVDMAAEKASLEAQIEAGFKALQAQDFDTFKGLCTADMMHYTHLGTKWDLAGLQQFFADHITDHTITTSNHAIHISDDASMAWVTLDEDTQYKMDGVDGTYKAQFTMAFSKDGGSWKLAHFQRTIEMPMPDESM